MPLFEHNERLIQALEILNNHREEISNFYNSILRLQVQTEGIDMLKQAFRASVKYERRGASFNRSREAVQAFDSSITDISQRINAILPQNPREAHRILFEWLVTLPHVNQKIAAMFIKFLCVYLNMWPTMIPYLFVPIDRVVLKILAEKLQVYTGSWNQSPSVTNPQGHLYVRGNRMSSQYAKFTTFQNELAQIAQSAGVDRILVDELWLIGNIYCKEYPICNLCWIKDNCQGSPF